MISYAKILKQSYAITLRYPVLWLFGLFVVGGFNINFFHFRLGLFDSGMVIARVRTLIVFFESHPLILAGASVAVLLVSFGALILTNWCRTMLILGIDSIVVNKRVELEKQWLKSWYVLRPLIGLSLFTTSLMVLVAVVLASVPLIIVDQSQFQTVVWVLTGILFLPLAFTISCINIFATFFLIIHKKSLTDSLNLATDLFITKWTTVLGLALVLMLIYIVCFVSGIAIIGLIKLILNAILVNLVQLGILRFSAMIQAVHLLTGLLLWLLLAGLNVFFNTALLLLFYELIKPIETPEKATAAAPAVS